MPFPNIDQIRLSKLGAYERMHALIFKRQGSFMSVGTLRWHQGSCSRHRDLAAEYQRRSYRSLTLDQGHLRTSCRCYIDDDGR